MSPRPMPVVQTLMERNPYDARKVHFELAINYGEEYFGAHSHNEHSLVAIHDTLIAVVDMLQKYLNAKAKAGEQKTGKP